MRAAIIVFPGTNREQDAKRALNAVCVNQVDFVWHKDNQFHDTPDIVLVPGGFSWGDYLRAGAIAAHSNIMTQIAQLSQKGTRIIGICNGFQILCEAGLLPGILMRNKQLNFICRPVGLKVEHNQHLLTSRYQKDEIVTFPLAHQEGNYFAQNHILEELNSNQQILLRYISDASDDRLNDADNLNGSQQHIAGICNKMGNVMGLMPHPENAIFDYHPSQDGLKLFAGLCHG